MNATSSMNNKLGDLNGIWATIFKAMMLLQPMVVMWCVWVTTQLHNRDSDIKLILQSIQHVSAVVASHAIDGHPEKWTQFELLKARVSLIEANLRRTQSQNP